MKDPLVRFGVAMEESLLKELDRIADERGVTRSEILRDLSRAEVARSRVAKGAPAAGALTLVYNHHVRELTEKLTEEQHRLGEQVRATMHVHLDAERCLEVIVLRGKSDALQKASEKLLATRGVEQGGLQLVAEKPGTHTHSYTHVHEDDHDHHHHDGDHDHSHPHEHEPAAKKKR
ncbi:MAG TPA: nickel-responsive transcriptional regulator NikR [Polyangiaceae bacterium]